MPRKNELRVEDVLGDGWMTPNTYCGRFAEIGDFPAVYALALYEKDCWFQKEIRFQIAYIGMSKRLSRRFAQHNALDVIKKTGQYYQIWFKRALPDELRDLERKLIRRHDPPLNLIGRKVALP